MLMFLKPNAAEQFNINQQKQHNKKLNFSYLQKCKSNSTTTCNSLTNHYYCSQPSSSSPSQSFNFRRFNSASLAAAAANTTRRHASIAATITLNSTATQKNLLAAIAAAAAISVSSASCLASLEANTTMSSSGESGPQLAATVVSSCDSKQQTKLDDNNNSSGSNKENVDTMSSTVTNEGLAQQSTQQPRSCLPKSPKSGLTSNRAVTINECIEHKLIESNVADLHTAHPTDTATTSTVAAIAAAAVGDAADNSNTPNESANVGGVASSTSTSAHRGNCSHHHHHHHHRGGGGSQHSQTHHRHCHAHASAPASASSSEQHSGCTKKRHHRHHSHAHHSSATSHCSKHSSGGGVAKAALAALPQLTSNSSEESSSTVVSSSTTNLNASTTTTNANIDAANVVGGDDDEQRRALAPIKPSLNSQQKLSLCAKHIHKTHRRSHKCSLHLSQQPDSSSKAATAQDAVASKDSSGGAAFSHKSHSHHCHHHHHHSHSAQASSSSSSNTAAATSTAKPQQKQDLLAVGASLSSSFTAPAAASCSGAGHTHSHGHLHHHHHHHHHGHHHHHHRHHYGKQVRYSSSHRPSVSSLKTATGVTGESVAATVSRQQVLESRDERMDVALIASSFPTNDTEDDKRNRPSQLSAELEKRMSLDEEEVDSSADGATGKPNQETVTMETSPLLSPKEKANFEPIASCGNTNVVANSGDSDIIKTSDSKCPDDETSKLMPTSAPKGLMRNSAQSESKKGRSNAPNVIATPHYERDLDERVVAPFTVANIINDRRTSGPVPSCSNSNSSVQQNARQNSDAANHRAFLGELNSSSSHGGGGNVIDCAPSSSSGGGAGVRDEVRGGAECHDQSALGNAQSNDRRCRLCWCWCCPCPSITSRVAIRDATKTNKADTSVQSVDKKCYTPSNTSLEEIRSWNESFDKLMKCEDGRRIFQDFLRCEYSEENILFWIACEELKKEKDMKNIINKTRDIYEDYISILSAKEVSLDSRVRDVINNNIKTPTSNIFDDAQLQIYTLMHRDSYPRFINSPMYKKLAQLPMNSPSSTTATPAATGGSASSN